MNDKQPGFFARFMKSASQIEHHELRSVLLSFFLVFTLMSAWYILRPVRDAMASDWSDTEVSFLFNITFAVSVVVVALYGVAVSRVAFRYLVPGVYGFFGCSFVAFYFGVSGVEDRVLIDKIFYVWVSVFSLFHVSVFWSLMSDLFTKEQSNRLFAFIAVGSTVGALVGPLIPALFADDLGTDKLMLIASVALLVPIALVLYLERLKSIDLRNEGVHADLSAARIGGNPFAGFKMFVTNPYLLAIGVFILLYTTIGSFVYFEQKNLLADFSREERTSILASVDLVVNILTFTIGLFATSRIIKNFGMAATLAMVPVFIAAGLLILAFAPVLIVVLALQVARRAGNYAITRPGREMLFTAVDRETRFKAKPVIDIAVYRGGDALSSIAFAGLTDGLGFGLAAMAGIGAGIAAVWAAVGVYLGRVFVGRDAAATAAAIKSTPQEA
ncbi:MAG: MFS transporter [Gammaproteobacteria bacterium]|jgi:AAA family ATP:ADP antiporter|nr:MFS transporter [Gammaproteobacteria bacterium]